MALTTQPKPVTFAYSLGLNAEPIMHGAEHASATYGKGAFLIDDDAGLINETTSPLASGAVTTRTLGVAHNAATGVTSADVVFTAVGPQTVFEITLTDLSAGTHTLAATDMWQVYAITKGTTNWYLNANSVPDTGGGLVVGFKDAVGTTDGRVYIIVTSTIRGTINTGSAVI